MKQITAIVRPEVLEPLKDALTEAGASGMTIFEVPGFGHQHGWKEFVRGSEVLLTMVPKVEVMLVVDDGEVESLVERICTVARTGEVGDGKIFITPVDDVVRIRTGERGATAL